MVMQSAGAATLAPPDPVPLGQPFTNGREVELVAEVLRSGRLARGPMLARFEQAIAAFVGVEHAVAVSSGSVGMHVTVTTCGWGPGDEVITSPFATAAATDAIRRTGATVVFADIDVRTLTLDPAAVAAAVTDRTRGLVLVDRFGWPTDGAAFADLVERHDLEVLRDSREALGASIRGVSIAAAGAPTVFSLSGDKQLTTGEGGVLCTNDAQLAERWRGIVDHRRPEGDPRPAHEALGYDVRLGDIASAVGVGQLEKLNRMLAMRHEVAADYERLLASVPGVTTPVAGERGVVRSWFAYQVLLGEDAPARDEVAERLRERGIECRVVPPCVHLLRSGAGSASGSASPVAGSFPVAEAAAERSLAIPFFPQISPQQQERVVAELRDALDAG